LISKLAPSVALPMGEKAGGWRDELTPDQVARIEADRAPMMRRLGYCRTRQACPFRVTLAPQDNVRHHN